MHSKKDLRKHYSGVRKAAKTEDKDKLICTRVLAEERVAGAQTVLLFASFGSEPDTWDIAEKLLMSNKAVAFPRCGSEGHMTFHTVGDISQLRGGEPGKYGIFEPGEVLPCPDFNRGTVCIVPGLAFTLNGGRLGYGGGYYDRFLSVHKDIYTIALAYEELIAPQLPLEEHDLRVDQIITEERTVLCNAE
ncbi:MAG: 5-formyltetrahydrofolate cyclo-ligase [Ruminococcus sp.]|nr:5-formyltetrahydrofolate cyclo-ligase [Ruminococcus sp.]